MKISSFCLLFMVVLITFGFSSLTFQISLSVRLKNITEDFRGHHKDQDRKMHELIVIKVSLRWLYMSKTHI